MSSSFEYSSRRTNDIWSSGSLPMSVSTKSRVRVENSSTPDGESKAVAACTAEASNASTSNVNRCMAQDNTTRVRVP